MTPREISESLKRYQTIGLAAIALVLGSTLGWAAFTSISGAVIAPGLTVVEGYSKKVQHKEGGIVREIAISEGAKVAAGQLLLRLDDTEGRSELAIVDSALREWLAKRARLEAQRDGVATLVFPNELQAHDAEAEMDRIFAGQTKLFEAQRGVLEGQLKQLRERIGQINEEVEGLSAQTISKDKQIELIQQELTGLKKLQKEGLVPLARVLQLEREAARLLGERGELKANIAKSKGQISETQLQMIQIEDDYRGKVLNELREVEGKIREYEERRIAIKATIDRTTVTAPISGYVHQLSVHTVGGVIAPGETVMMIVPADDKMVVEARIRPQDIEQVRVGQDAVLHFPGVENRLTPQLHGRVVYVSADLTQPKQSGEQPYYEVRLSVDDSEVAKLGITKLKPGMPSEAYLRTRERSPLNYLLKPLSDQISRTFRER